MFQTWDEGDTYLGWLLFYQRWRICCCSCCYLDKPNLCNGTTLSFRTQVCQHLVPCFYMGRYILLYNCRCNLVVLYWTLDVWYSFTPTLTSCMSGKHCPERDSCDFGRRSRGSRGSLEMDWRQVLSSFTYITIPSQTHSHLHSQSYSPSYSYSYSHSYW